VSKPPTHHGYVAYTHGCRCEVCREAKSTYMRQRRTEARREAQRHSVGRRGEPGSVRYVANVRNHGTSYAYYERGCRCRECHGFVVALNADLPCRTERRSEVAA
jgi:hypothetical protein